MHQEIQGENWEKTLERFCTANWILQYLAELPTLRGHTLVLVRRLWRLCSQLWFTAAAGITANTSRSAGTVSFN
jgi:hypothetical protein